MWFALSCLLIWHFKTKISVSKTQIHILLVLVAGSSRQKCHCPRGPVRQFYKQSLRMKKLRVRGREHLTLDLRTISIRTGSQVSPLKPEVSVHSDMALSLPAWLYNGSRAS